MTQAQARTALDLLESTDSRVAPASGRGRHPGALDAHLQSGPTAAWHSVQGSNHFMLRFS